jgi:uncharacterized protein YxjI
VKDSVEVEDRDGNRLTMGGKKWSRVAVPYGVQIAPDAVTPLAASAAIDMMAHESR